jgi:hypothetical protein
MVQLGDEWIIVSVEFAMLEIVVETLNAVHYRDYILLPIISPLIIREGLIYTYQQENARCHVTHICTLLERHLTGVLPWPELSPNLSPIELRRHVCKTPKSSEITGAASQKLLEECDNISHAFIGTFIYSMRYRCEESINFRGCHTWY